MILAMIAKRIPARSLFSGAARFSVILACALVANFTVAAPADPWSPAQTVQPAQLAAELQDSQHPHPLVIYVGVRTLFDGAHIPGAIYFGPGSSEQGIAELKKYAAGLPRNSNVVLYCGCCPLEKCPNLRPAFSALKDFPLARLRVLILPNSFNADWVEKGFPVEKGS
jgi:thiosulfate/3-mercaptopyruvate sulfurtransferase